MTTPNAVETILADLNASERAELEHAMHALHQVSTQDIAPGEMFDAEGLRQMLDMVPPRVKAKLMQLHALTDEKRSAPYQPKMGTSDWASTLGLDADTMERVKATLDAGDVAYKLADRMGGPGATSTPSDSENRRAAIRQALEQDQPMAARRAFAERAIREAAPQLSRRDAIAALVDQAGGSKS